jgi:hypothetical protein
MHFATSVLVRATPREVFDYLDDPERIGAHMSGGSLMMAGGSMHYHLDAEAGRRVGSVIRVEGRMLGLALAPLYARWCASRIAVGTRAHFAQGPGRSRIA